MKKLITLMTTILLSAHVNATLISVNLDQSSYNVGDTVTATVNVSEIDLDDFGFQKLISAFDLSMIVDQSLLSLNSVNFGDKLDVDPFLTSITYSEQLATNVDVGETSFAFFADLFTAQDGLSSFTLATMSFSALSAGQIIFELNKITLTDDLSNSFEQVRFDAQSANILVASNEIPEPATMFLLCLALLMLINKPVITNRN